MVELPKFQIYENTVAKILLRDQYLRMNFGMRALDMIHIYSCIFEIHVNTVVPPLPPDKPTPTDGLFFKELLPFLT